MFFVKKPQKFQIVVTSNFFGYEDWGKKVLNAIEQVMVDLEEFAPSSQKLAKMAQRLQGTIGKFQL